MATRTKANIPFLINDSGVLVGYVDAAGVERTIGGSQIVPGNTPPANFVIAQSAVAASVTGTTNETTLATIAIPAGAMGANGQLRITALFSTTNSANNKILRANIGGTAFLATTVTAVASTSSLVMIRNRNSLASQVGFAPTISAGVGTSATAVVTATVDMSVAQNLTITGQLANTGETITLEAYTVEILNP